MTTTMRTGLMVVLACGAVFGIVSGFRHHHFARYRRDAFERHIAKICVDAARGGEHHGEHPHQDSMRF